MAVGKSPKKPLMAFGIEEMTSEKKMPTDVYRDIVITHLKYIREKVAKNEKHLDKLNNRVVETEKDLASLKGITTTAGIIFSAIVAYIFKVK